MAKQQGGEFASTDPTTRTQYARLQERRVSTKISLKPRAQGFDANFELDFVQRYDAFTFAVGPRFQFGDAQFMGAYFSVTPFEALLNGHVYPYEATGGLASVGGFGSIKYQFTPAWSATVFGGVNRYVSSAAGSPIPNRLGSLDNMTAGALVAYTFNWNWF